jgi:branched-chain amino acid transport system substrate-binding protein
MSTKWLVAFALAATIVAGCSDGDAPGTASDNGASDDGTSPDDTVGSAIEPDETGPGGTTAGGTAAGDDATDGGADAVPTTRPGPCRLPEPLRIGYVADLSGVGAAFDGPATIAARTRVDLLNAAGGVGGLPVELVVRDVGTDPTLAQQATQELLAAGVDAILGPPSVEVGLAVLESSGDVVPVVFPGATDPQLADPSRGAFLAGSSDPVQAAAAAELAVGLGASRVVTFSADDDRDSADAATAFTLAFENARGELLQQYSYSSADTDFTTQVEQIVQLDPPADALFTAMPMPALATLLQQLAFAGLGELIVIGAERFDAASPWTAGMIADGVHVTTRAFPSPDNEVQALVDAAAAAGTPIASTFGALGADAVEIVAQAAEVTCALDGPALIDAIDTIGELDVTTGTVTYEDSTGVPVKDVAIVVVSGGAPTLEFEVRPTFIPTL